MPQQSGSTLKAPRTRGELDALTARRGELQAQLRSLEERRFQLAVQRQAVEGQPLARDIDRRTREIDTRIDLLEKQTTQADQLIAEAHSRPEIVGGGPPSGGGPQWSLLEPPSPPPSTGVAVVPPVDVSGVVARALLLEGVGFLLFGALAWVYAVRRFERKLSGRAVGAVGEPAQIMQLQQSVDAIALEVERISENQRYVTKVIQEKSTAGQP
jgi:hypothetical protein